MSRLPASRAIGDPGSSSVSLDAARFSSAASPIATTPTRFPDRFPDVFHEAWRAPPARTARLAPRDHPVRMMRDCGGSWRTADARSRMTW